MAAIELTARAAAAAAAAVDRNDANDDDDDDEEEEEEEAKPRVWTAADYAALHAAIAQMPSQESFEMRSIHSQSSDAVEEHAKHRQQHRDEAQTAGRQSTESRRGRASLSSSGHSSELYREFRRKRAQTRGVSDISDDANDPWLKYHLLKDADKRGLQQMQQFDAWDSSIAHALLQFAHGFWLDIEKPDAHDIRLLSTMHDLEDELQALLQSETLREQATFTRNGLVVTVRMLDHDDDEHLTIILTRKAVVTLHSHPLMSVRVAMEAVLQLNHYLHPHRIMYLLLLDNLKRWEPAIRSAEDDLESLHDLALSLGEADKDEMLLRVASTRQQLSQMQRRLVGKRNVLRMIDANSFMFFSVETQQYMRDMLDHLHDMLRALTLARDALNQLESNYMAKVSLEVADKNKATNQAIKVYSLAATIGLPLTGIGGNGGMNIFYPGRVEYTDSATGFVLYIVLMALFAGLLVLAFKWLRLL